MLFEELQNVDSMKLDHTFSLTVYKIQWTSWNNNIWVRTKEERPSTRYDIAKVYSRLLRA